MKKIILCSIPVILCVAACQPKVQDKPVDLASVKDSISLVIDNYYKAFNSKDLEAYATLLADDGLFCGTDPDEFWNKSEAVDLMKQQFADTSFTYTILPDKKEIKVSADGESAIIVNQYVLTELSPKIPIREITYITKTENRWLISFTSYSFVTENENVDKLNKAL